MMVLHLLHVPGALVWSWLMGAQVRRGRFNAWKGYALALIPGALIAAVSWILQNGPPPRNEQPWQGLLLWSAWSALGFIQGWKLRKQPRRFTTLGLNREP